MVIVLVMIAGVAMAETLHPDGKGGYNSSKGHYSPDGKGGLNGPIGYLEPDGAGNFFGPHGEYYENIEGVLDGPDNYDTRQGTLVEEAVEVIPEVIFRKRKKSKSHSRTISEESNGYSETNSPIYENYKENLINYNGGFNYQPSYNYKPSWSHKKNVNRRRVPDIPYLPPPPIPHVNVPQGAIDVTSGQYLPPAAGGVIDPRTGTFHIDAGGGYINSQTGEFSPKF